MIRARLIIEAQGKPQKNVEDSLKNVVKQIEKVDSIEVFDIKSEPVILDRKIDLYSGLVDIGIETEKFESLFFVVLRFGPTAIIVLEPEKIEVEIGELQTTLNDMANILHALSVEAMVSKMELEAKKSSN